jgi:carbonic anhydrase
MKRYNPVQNKGDPMSIRQIFSCLGLTSALAFGSGHGDAPGSSGAKPANTAAHPASGHAAPAGAKITPDEALKRLMGGNRRFTTAAMTHPDQSVERRTSQAAGQAPFAIIVSCSDSRVPPEILFDQGIGDLFVIRSAGEVVTDVGIGSIEYAAAHLSVPLIMVLGHERCGAVKATVDGGEAPGSIGSIVTLIKPAVDKAKAKGGEVLENAIKLNAGLVSERIAASPIIAERLAKGELKIVRGYYDLDDGVVKSLP